jgi:NDP-sugar pyrophosphorylase family protein
MPYAFGNIFFEDDLVLGIEEKPDLVTYALAGIYIMRPDIFRLIPDNEYFGMDNLIKKMLSEQKPISKYELKEYWLDIGRIDDYELAQKDFQENFYGVNK